MPNDPQLEAEVAAKGFVLTNDDNVYTAVLVAPVDPEVSAGSPEALLIAIDSYWQRQLASKPGWPNIPTVLT
jgi:hypothetical protein